MTEIFELRVVESTTSTMDDVRQAAESGKKPGFSVVARAQSAGRGSRGRTWVSKNAGNLYATSLISMPEAYAHFATLMLASATLTAFDDADGLSIKWPNDIYYENKKCGGILAEKLGDNIVIGIGLNLAPDDYESVDGISLSELNPAAPETVYKKIYAAFAEEKHRLLNYGTRPLVTRLQEKLLWLNQRVRIDDCEGIFVGLNQQGAARLRIAGNEHLNWAGTMRVCCERSD